ncbi:MAG: DNA-binding protein [Clostridia bacterium]|nr:DNA-binding protein [Clostridia bacterium]MBQ3003516.1 DNA-binding protein [Clostridia bacterium]
MFEKNMNISLLLDFYGEVLNEKQREILDLYYNEDLSLAEIAESNGLTRQGVRHVIKKAEEAVTLLESKLGLAQRFTALGTAYDAIADRLLALVSSLETGASKEEVIERLKAEAESVRALKDIGE